MSQDHGLRACRSSSFLRNPAPIVAQFYEATGNRRAMGFEQFRAAMNIRSVIFARKLFDALDENNSGDITLEKFVGGLRTLRSPDLTDRCQFIFSIFDVDGDGAISSEDLKTLLEASVEEEGGSLTEEETAGLVFALLQLFEADVSSTISYAVFENVLQTYSDLLSGLTFGRFGMRPETSERRPQSRCRRRVNKAASWVVNNPQLVATYGSVMLLMLAAFLWGMIKYAGNCDDVDMDYVDPVTGYSRQDVVRMSENLTEMDVTSETARYMVFSKEMAAMDSTECLHARKRMLFGWTLNVAKGSAQAMKVTFTLILLPVSRNLMTTLRDTALKHVFRFDEAIAFHKLAFAASTASQRRLVRRFLGTLGFWLAWMHTICHVANVLRWSDSSHYRYWSWAFPEDRTVENMQGVMRNVQGEPLYANATRLVPTEDYEDGLPRMFYNDGEQPSLTDLLQKPVAITGVILIVIYSIAVLFAFKYPKNLSIFKKRQNDDQKPWRKRILAVGRWLNDFNNFWYSHHLFALFYVALLLHPLPSLPEDGAQRGWNDAWLWVGVPVLIYVLERLLRFRRSGKNTRVVSAELLDGDVVGLRVLRPRGFKYTPGQYVFVKCPQISRFEWHPFTLTSCPGDSYLGIHVRKVGDWTGGLHALVEQHASNKAAALSDEEKPGDLIPTHSIKSVVGDAYVDSENFDFDVDVDGPFGAPAQNYTDYRVIVLIGAGIGVTPFASVLTDLLDSLKECACPKCGYSNPRHLRSRTRKVYFYWTVRSRSEASWFKRLLEAIAETDEDGLLEIRINVTGIKRANDIRTMMLRLAQYECGEQATSDHHIRTVTRFGRIDWNEVFERVRQDFPQESNVGVFYCGPNTIAKTLSKMCMDNSKGTTKFHFLKESFG